MLKSKDCSVSKPISYHYAAELGNNTKTSKSLYTNGLHLVKICLNDYRVLVVCIRSLQSHRAASDELRWCLNEICLAVPCRFRRGWPTTVGIEASSKERSKCFLHTSLPLSIQNPPSTRYKRVDATLQTRTSSHHQSSASLSISQHSFSFDLHHSLPLKST